MSELRQAQLPKEWNVKKLGDVCVKTANIKWEAHKGESFRYIDLSAVSRESLKITESSLIDSTNAPSRAKKIIYSGDVLFATTRPTLKRAAIVPDEYDNQISSTGFVVLRPDSSEIITKYIYYILQSESFMDEMTKLQRGASYPAVTDGDVKRFQIPIPQLEEQKQIVAVLDKAFAAIDLAKANIKKNLQNAKELFQSKLNEIFTQKGEGWKEKTLGEVAKFKNGLNYSQHSKGHTLPVIGVGDFQKNIYVPVEELELTTIDSQLDQSYEVKKSDILTVRSNGSKHLIGRCMLVPEVAEQTSFSGFIIRIRFDALEIKPKFLLWLMKSKTTVERLTSGGGGANINNINQKKLSALPIVYPSSFSKQLEIIEMLDGLSEEIENLEAKYLHNLKNLDELKKSILQKAFNGELVAQ